MKNLFLLILGATFSLGTLWAQSSGPGEPPHKKQDQAQKLEQMKTELNLTEDQVEQLKAMHEKYKPQRQKIRYNEAMTQDEKKEAMKELNQAKQADLKQILTEQQYIKFTQMRKEHHKNSPKGHHHKHGEAPNQGE